MIATGRNETLQLNRRADGKNLDQLDILEDQRAYLKSLFNFDPLPCVDRVIFLATPHRGARMAQTLVGRIGRALISLPKNVVNRLENGLAAMGVGRANIPTGIDNLRSDSSFVQALNILPFNPEVTCHSIIGNEKAFAVAGGGRRGGELQKLPPGRGRIGADLQVRPQCAEASAGHPGSPAHPH
jgi:hypothetical protein